MATGLGTAVLLLTLALQSTGPVELIRYLDQSAHVTIGPATYGKQKGLCIWFECTEDLHFYASPRSAPSASAVLQIAVRADGMRFARPIFPAPMIFSEPGTGRRIDVYSKRFQVFIPIVNPPDLPSKVTVTIKGVACTSQVCLPPFERQIDLDLDLSGTMPSIQITDSHDTSFMVQILPYLGLAIIAGISINIMPCVLPVLPIIVMRLIRQAHGTSTQRVIGGLAFCSGMIVFFLLLAIISLVIRLTTGMLFDINSLFRYPAALIALFLAILLFALVLLDVVTIAIPAGLAKNNQQNAAAFGTGLLAAVLSIPCSGALLGFVLVWAQTQPALISSIVILTIGIGMALPYGILVAIPGLLEQLPRPGRWMDLFKRSCGFLLILISVKLALAGLPKERLINVLFYGVIFCFCVWAWASWVDRETKPPVRWLIRLCIAALGIASAMYLLPAPSHGPIQWQPYDRSAIQLAHQAGRPVLLKFTADWCTNCTVLERRVFYDKKVADAIATRHILAIKADTTLHDSTATKDLTEIYGQGGGVPVTILLLPDGNRTVLRGIFDKQRLLDLLEVIPQG